MAAFKEIVTKAVVGKGKKQFKNSYTVETEFEPTTVLGCWVINHKFKGYKAGDKTIVDGSFDINIWYSYDNDSKTAVINKQIDYNEKFNVTITFHVIELLLIRTSAFFFHEDSHIIAEIAWHFHCRASIRILRDVQCVQT